MFGRLKDKLKGALSVFSKKTQEESQDIPQEEIDKLIDEKVEERIAISKKKEIVSKEVEVEEVVEEPEDEVAEEVEEPKEEVTEEVVEEPEDEVQEEVEESKEEIQEEAEESKEEVQEEVEEPKEEVTEEVVEESKEEIQEEAEESKEEVTEEVVEESEDEVQEEVEEPKEEVQEVAEEPEEEVQEEVEEPKEEVQEEVEESKEEVEEVAEEPEDEVQEEVEESKEDVQEEVEEPEDEVQEKVEEPEEDVQEEVEEPEDEVQEEVEESKEEKKGFFSKIKKSLFSKKEEFVSEPVKDEKVEVSKVEVKEAKEEVKEEETIEPVVEEPKVEEKSEEVKGSVVEEPKVEKKAQEVQEEKKGFFSKLKQTLTTKTINNEKFEELFWELVIVLLENNVSVEVIDKIKDDLKIELVDKPLPRDLLGAISERLKLTLQEILDIEKVDLIADIDKKDGPFIVAFFGINGAGKTTSIAKLANYLQEKGKSVVLAACDTFRAAAIDQLQEHADKLKVKMIKHDYGSDAAAVAFDAIAHAQKEKIDVVLIDTAGRLHSNTNLMAELEKIIRVTKPDMKIFVGESITGNDCIEQAKKFNELVQMDGAILTKVDVDDKGGAPLSISYTIKKPILFLGVGQEYKDFEEFDPKVILGRLGF